MAIYYALLFTNRYQRLTYFSCFPEEKIKHKGGVTAQGHPSG